MDLRHLSSPQREVDNKVRTGSLQYVQTVTRNTEQRNILDKESLDTQNGYLF